MVLGLVSFGLLDIWTRFRVTTENKGDWLGFLSTTRLLLITENSLPLELVRLTSRAVVLNLKILLA